MVEAFARIDHEEVDPILSITTQTAWSWPQATSQFTPAWRTWPSASEDPRCRRSRAHSGTPRNPPQIGEFVILSVGMDAIRLLHYGRPQIFAAAAARRNGRVW